MRECQETHSGPRSVGQNGLRRSHENGEALKEIGQVCEQTVFLGDEERAIQDVLEGRSNGGRSDGG